MARESESGKSNMPSNQDLQKFRNEDLVLKVTQAIDRRKWDENKYEAFLDELCDDREYQKEAIRTALRYLLGQGYGCLLDLAKANFNDNSILHARYGSWDGMQRHLQLPNQLSASLDLATGTGKSYVLYGIAAILLAEGAVDRVLVLCPSTTIEAGLLEKFRMLASHADLRGVLPSDARIAAPSIINASQTITEGSICVENYHAILEHVGSSIGDSLAGTGARTAVLSDEAHHVANESAAKTKRWKEFLLDPAYGFRYLIGVSGTCYVEDDYFSDVIYRYSLSQAMEQKYVKKVDYVSEMPRAGEPDEKWQLISNRHEDNRKKLVKKNIRPLTIIVTPTVARCKDVGDELKSFLVEACGVSPDVVNSHVLVVYSGAPDVLKLSAIDTQASKVEWIVSVSMLNEGWDVKRVFQIVPHEERAFNSKLLVAQVLGRGLRIPDGWKEQPTVTVFNHDAWASRIRHLVNEVLELDKRLSSHVVPDSQYHFDLENIDYTLSPTSVKKPMTGEYNLFLKGYVDLATDSPEEDVSIRFERAGTGETYDWLTHIHRKTYTAREVATVMYERLEQAQDPDDPDPNMRTVYTDKYSVDELEKIVSESLSRRDTTVATEAMKQKCLQSLGTLRRKTSENVRYTLTANTFVSLSTRVRQGDSVSAADLRSNKTFFYTDQTRDSLHENQIEFFDEAIEPGGGYKVVSVTNRHDFKTPLNAVIADSENERRFINHLLRVENLPHYNAWMKSTSIRFYEIDYAWKKGEHPKRGKFSPDFFIRAGDLILVIEIKGDEDIAEPSDENIKKNEYALAHFARLNEWLKASDSSVRYQFNFLTEKSFNKFFDALRKNGIATFRSELDVRLTA
jgi:type III restriction enzyme